MDVIPKFCLLLYFQIINYSTKIFSKAKCKEAKFLTLGVGAVNVAFTIMSVSEHSNNMSDLGTQYSVLTLTFGNTKTCLVFCLVFLRFYIFAFFFTQEYMLCVVSWFGICFFSKLFLVERVGRRKLLLIGFLVVAFCNLLMTITDSLLVKLIYVMQQQINEIISGECTRREKSMYWLQHLLYISSGNSSGHSWSSGASSVCSNFSIWAGSRPHHLVHWCWALWPASPTHCYGFHQHA